MSKKIYYSKPYLVTDLHRMQRHWRDHGIYDDFQMHVIAAIDGHHEDDRVSVRLESESHVRTFNALMDGAAPDVTRYVMESE